MSDSQSTPGHWATLRFAFLVAIVCALAVSFTAVQLRPRYVQNLENEKLSQLQGILHDIGQDSADDVSGQLQSIAVSLDSGETNLSIDTFTYDARLAALDPQNSTSVPPALDLAGIKRRANHAIVHLLRDDGDDLQAIILPVWGIGYQSALYGYLALSADTERVLAIKFYEQGETPGLGDRIQEPGWEQLWRGQSVYGSEGEVVLRVGGNWAGDYSRIDGISGATRTSQGVEGLVRFWLGSFGFGPFLDKIRSGEVG